MNCQIWNICICSHLHVNFKGPPQWCSLIVIGLSVSPYVQYIFFPLAQFSLLITFIHRVPMVTGCLVNLNLFQGLDEIFVYSYNFLSPSTYRVIFYPYKSPFWQSLEKHLKEVPSIYFEFYKVANPIELTSS